MTEATIEAPDYEYVGAELALFARATNWKTYFGRCLRPFIQGEVLEVGAGLGGTSRFLCHPGASHWTLLEPDRRLIERLQNNLAAEPLPVPAEVVTGTLAELPPDRQFDTLLYIDVIEHIDDDAAEVARAVSRVRPGGRVIALSPAHQWLYSPFDKAIGHFRRYTRRSIAALTPPTAVLERCFYLDAVGLLASLGNRMLLKSAMPTAAQIATWDRLMVPLSRWVDPVLGRRLGKSVVAVWRAP
jgi:SAM-dependent methyltransferase